MTDQTINAILPRLPNAEMFADPRRTIMSASGEVLLAYHPQTRCGFMYAIADARWSILVPISFLDFSIAFALSGHRIADTEDARAWTDANLFPNDHLH